MGASAPTSFLFTMPYFLFLVSRCDGLFFFFFFLNHRQFSVLCQTRGDDRRAQSFPMKSEIQCQRSCGKPLTMTRERAVHLHPAYALPTYGIYLHIFNYADDCMIRLICGTVKRLWILAVSPRFVNQDGLGLDRISHPQPSSSSFCISASINKSPCLPLDLFRWPWLTLFDFLIRNSHAVMHYHPGKPRISPYMHPFTSLRTSAESKMNHEHARNAPYPFTFQPSSIPAPPRCQCR